MLAMILERLWVMSFQACAIIVIVLIARELLKKYPKICKAVHQKNGGHGEAVNAGLRNAAGYFFKVVDSDDRVGKEAFGKLLDVMRKAIL